MPALLLALHEQRQEITLDVFDVVLHSALQLGAERRAGRDEKAVVFGKAAVATIDQGVLIGGAHDGRLQVIRHHALGHSAEELEGVDVAAEEGALTLVESDLAVDPSGVTKPTREEPHLALPPTLAIPVDPQITEVHLHDLSRGGRAQDHRRRKLRIAMVNPPAHRRFAHRHSHLRSAKADG